MLFVEWVDFTKSGWLFGLAFVQTIWCLGRSELGHGLGSLRHGMLGKLTRKHDANGGLWVWPAVGAERSLGPALVLLE